MSSISMHEHFQSQQNLEQSIKQDILSLHDADFTVLSIHNEVGLDEVVNRMETEGIGIGGFNETVCYILGNAADDRFIHSVINLKGPERGSMAMALSHSAEKFIPLVDMEAIPQQMQQYFLEPVLMEAIFGQLAFLRVPVKKELINKLPPNVVSGKESETPMIQNWLPTNALAPVVKKMEARDMRVGITSLNRHGAGSIVDQYKGAELAKEYLGGYLYDEHYPNNIAKAMSNGKSRLPHGSFPIIEIGNHLGDHGVSLVRHGPYDHRALVALFPNKGIHVDLDRREDNTIDFPDEIIEEMEKAEDPQQVRLMVISFLKGLLTT